MDGSGAAGSDWTNIIIQNVEFNVKNIEMNVCRWGADLTVGWNETIQAENGKSCCPKAV